MKLRVLKKMQGRGCYGRKDKIVGRLNIGLIVSEMPGWRVGEVREKY